MGWPHHAYDWHRAFDAREVRVEHVLSEPLGMELLVKSQGLEVGGQGRGGRGGVLVGAGLATGGPAGLDSAARIQQPL